MEIVDKDAGHESDDITQGFLRNNFLESRHDPDFLKRPTYKEAEDIVARLVKFSQGAVVTGELEAETRHHGDWIRKGKQMFRNDGTSVQTLLEQLRVVDEKTRYCFDLADIYTPATKTASSKEIPNLHEFAPDEREEVFCLCRQPEAGIMIKCAVCHEWSVNTIFVTVDILTRCIRYHTTCLDMVRGQVEETETEVLTCPICDFHVVDSRHAARPELGALRKWRNEMLALPFRPDEEDVLERIIETAQRFRDFLKPRIDEQLLFRKIEHTPEQLFYLRKLEGADVLLEHETNFFRRELFARRPIAPNTTLSISLSYQEHIVPDRSRSSEAATT